MKVVVFDLVDTLIKWQPVVVAKKIFPEIRDHHQLNHDFTKSKIWQQLDLGLIDEEQATENFSNALGFEKTRIKTYFKTLKESFSIMPGMLDVLELLSAEHISIYCLSDNTQAQLNFLKEKFKHVFDLFSGMVVSCEVHYLKPSIEIFNCLFNKYELDPRHVIFFDDAKENIEAANKLHLHAFEFNDAAECKQQLVKLNVLINPDL